MLLNAGLAREEVNEVRRQFYASHSNLLELHRRGQLTQRDLFEIEQQWMQNDHVQTENDQSSSIRPTNTIIDTNNVGNIYHFFCGVFLGFFLGFVALIALLENSLSRRFQFGIRCGVTTMVLLSIFKYYFPTLLPYMM
ncbi:predicted protein [Naegleria gruberi]|uniref:Predicted protein n=1 Tax=Naegleria gruberi TaxID=5762 RepID=D2VNX7_NAEGR|nr:uncharacterized protein NAEGRDRAFT_70655 [Naegleria gruberi]EFC41496.1 predicted protein [Naegleria gruberi]|eukprot:XP_002674240.1 predicted protein [Naegleria gruberi strain NEG-M]